MNADHPRTPTRDSGPARVQKHYGGQQTMSDYDVDMTMREYYAAEGYDPEELANPRNVSPSDLDDESRVIAYTVVRNPDLDGPATTRAIDEYEIHAVVPADELGDYTDGAITYRGETPVTHAVHWAFQMGDVPKTVSIGYGDEMYGPDSKFDDPHGWDRTVGQVNSLSDDFIRFDL